MPRSETKFKELIEQSSAIIYTLDTAGKTNYISPRWHEMLGGPAEAAKGKHFSDLIHPEDVAKCSEFLRNILSGQTGSNRIEYRVRHADGSWRWHATFAAVQHNEAGDVAGLIGIAHDITHQRTTAERLTVSETRHRLLAEAANDVIWSMGADGSIRYISPAITHVRGLTPEEAMAQPMEQIHTPSSIAKVMDYFGRLHAALQTRSEPPRFRDELEYLRKDGSIMWAEVQVMPLMADDGSLIELVGVSRDISERKTYEAAMEHANHEIRAANQALAEANAKLERLAATDMLTGAWNRRYFEQRSQAEIAKFARHGPPLALIMLDIDHFKAINDHFGHLMGDRVLQALVDRLQRNVRASDVLARWGGEEFILLLPHSTLSGAVQLAEKLRRMVAEVPFEGVGTVSVSLGVAALQAGEDLDHWLQRADLALYEAKAGGRNQVCSVV